MKNKILVTISLIVLIILIVSIIFPQKTWESMVNSPGSPFRMTGFEYWEKTCVGYEKQVNVPDASWKSCYGLALGEKKCFGVLNEGEEISEISCDHRFYSENEGPFVRVETKIEVQDSNLSNWKTYRNEKYGFEFQYPDNSKITEKDNKEYFTLNFDNNQYYGWIIVEPLNKKFSINKGEEGYINGSQMIVYDIETKKEIKRINSNLSLNNWKGFTLFNPQLESVPKEGVFIPHGNYVYYISSGQEFPEEFEGESEVEYEKRFNLFKENVYKFNNSVLASFKFTK